MNHNLINKNGVLKIEINKNNYFYFYIYYFMLQTLNMINY